MHMNKEYSRLAVILHWLVAVGMIANVFLAWAVPFIADENIRFAIDTHKSIGITVLGLVILRVLWRVTHQPPMFPYRQPLLERMAAKLTHILLYALMLMIPISGWLHDSAWMAAAEHPMYVFGLFEWPRISAIMTLDPVTKEHWHALLGTVHTGLSYGLYALFVLHVAAALMHHFSRIQPVRGRGMLPG